MLSHCILSSLDSLLRMHLSVTMPNTKQTYSYVDEWRSLWEPDLDAIAYNGATCDPTKVDPKVLDWVKQHCGDEPRFIKVINRNAVHGQPGLLARSSACMCVPRPFVEENFRNLQRVVTLEKNGEPGRKWKVAFITASKHPIWLQGWRFFARDNHLKPGSVVVFELVGNSYFRFAAFDEDGITDQNVSTEDDAAAARVVRKELSYSSQSQPQPSSATESDPRVSTRNRVMLSDSDTEADARDRHSQLITPKVEPVPLPVPATPQKRRRLCKVADLATPGRDVSDCEGSGVDSGTLDSFNPLAFTVRPKRRPVTAVERQRAIDLAKAHSHVTTRPHFLVVLSIAHAYSHSKMILPDEFVRESGLPATGCRITLEDGTGETWVLYSRENVNFQVGLIRKGWALFALEHLLEEGDVCVFELSDRAARAILVHIFRVVQVPDSAGGHSFGDHYELHAK